MWEKASSRLQSQNDSAICDGLSAVLALLGDAREKIGDLSSAERFIDQALKQAKQSDSAHAAKSLPSLYSNLARIQLASGDTVSACTTLKVCRFSGAVAFLHRDDFLCIVMQHAIVSSAAFVSLLTAAFPDRIQTSEI